MKPLQYAVIGAGNGGNGPDSEGYYNADYEDKTGK